MGLTYELFPVSGVPRDLLTQQMDRAAIPEVFPDIPFSFRTYAECEDRSSSDFVLGHLPPFNVAWTLNYIANLIGG